MEETEIRRRAMFRAAIVGDALGVPFTGLKHGHIQQLLGGLADGFLADPLILPERPEKNYLPGLHSAVGQRLLACLAFRMKDDQGRDPVARVGGELLALAGEEEGVEHGHRLGALRLPGRPLRRAIERWKREYPWEEKDFLSAEEDSQGASAAISGIAAALVAPDNPSAAAESLARLTFFRPIAVGAAVAVAECARLLLARQEGKKLDGPKVAREVIEALRSWEAMYLKKHARQWKDLGWGPPTLLSAMLDPLPSLLRENNEELAIATILKTAETTESGRAPFPQPGFAGAAIPWILYRALGPMPARVALEDIQNRGGECNVVAAITAALFAARNGPSCMPDEWCDATLALPIVEKLLDDPSAVNFDKWVALENRWTQQEEALRDPLRKALHKQEDLEAERNRNHPKKSRLPPQEEALFAPPPHLWLAAAAAESDDPKAKKILRAARGKRKIDWKEERHQKSREKK